MVIRNRPAGRDHNIEQRSYKAPFTKSESWAMSRSQECPTASSGYSGSIELYPNFHNDFGFDAEKMLCLLVGSSREPLAKEALVLRDTNGVMKLKLITSATQNVAPFEAESDGEQCWVQMVFELQASPSTVIRAINVQKSGSF